MLETFGAHIHYRFDVWPGDVRLHRAEGISQNAQGGGSRLGVPVPWFHQKRSAGKLTIHLWWLTDRDKKPTSRTKKFSGAVALFWACWAGEGLSESELFLTRRPVRRVAAGLQCLTCGLVERFSAY